MKEDEEAEEEEEEKKVQFSQVRRMREQVTKIKLLAWHDDTDL